MATRDKFSEQAVATIAKIQSKKNKRLKNRRARNAKLREAGVKFAKTDGCYKG